MDNLVNYGSQLKEILLFACACLCKNLACSYIHFCLVSGDPDSVSGDFGEHPLYKMLGYFSLIGLLRLHSLLGDYYQAIKVLENIELNKQVGNMVIIIMRLV